MQHVLPSRNACVAYRGMSIPVPAHTLCGAYRNPTHNIKPLIAGGKEIDGGSQQDSGFITTSSEVSGPGDSVAHSPCLVEERSLSCEGEEGEDKLIENDSTSGGEVPTLRTVCEPNVVPLPPHRAVPVVGAETCSVSRQSWSCVGRGRALHQLRSQMTCSVGRRQTASPSHLTGGPTAPLCVVSIVLIPLEMV